MPEIPQGAQQLSLALPRTVQLASTAILNKYDVRWLVTAVRTLGARGQHGLSLISPRPLTPLGSQDGHDILIAVNIDRAMNSAMISIPEGLGPHVTVLSAPRDATHRRCSGDEAWVLDRPVSIQRSFGPSFKHVTVFRECTMNAAEWLPHVGPPSRRVADLSSGKSRW